MNVLRAATPWDALLRRPQRPPKVSVTVPEAQAQAGTKLAALLALLAARESASTLTLGACAELSSRQVWGLLKAPRAAGQVRFESGRWSLVRSYAGRDVERAVALLRSRGWTVQPPEGHGE